MDEPTQDESTKKHSDDLRVLGIDPGLNITGYGVLAVNDGQVAVIEAGVVRSKPRHSFPDRIKTIYDGVLDVIDTLHPDCVGLEELYSHYERPKTSIIMGHARGVICLAAGQRGLSLESYAATQVKKILTGNGRASKEQVQLAVTRHLGLQEVPQPADVADAIAIGLCHFYLNVRQGLPR
ncbi:UNVERIFIED_CONTAM: hypothetical protein GTU68_041535 [Idotea baltica]|nr:hypothetical protein [Idotea baltica]